CCCAPTDTAATSSIPPAASMLIRNADHHCCGSISVPSGCGEDEERTTAPVSASQITTLQDWVDESMPATSATPAKLLQSLAGGPLSDDIGPDAMSIQVCANSSSPRTSPSTAPSRCSTTGSTLSHRMTNFSPSRTVRTQRPTRCSWG